SFASFASFNVAPTRCPDDQYSKYRTFTDSKCNTAAARSAGRGDLPPDQPWAHRAAAIQATRAADVVQCIERHKTRPAIRRLCARASPSRHVANRNRE